MLKIGEVEMSEDEIAAVVKNVLCGLMVMHNSNQIHRDIKAANVLLSLEGEVKLADFGVTAELDKTLAKK